MFCLKTHNLFKFHRDSAIHPCPLWCHSQAGKGEQQQWMLNSWWIPDEFLVNSSALKEKLNNEHFLNKELRWPHHRHWWIVNFGRSLAEISLLSLNPWSPGGCSLLLLSLSGPSRTPNLSFPQWQQPNIEHKPSPESPQEQTIRRINLTQN